MNQKVAEARIRASRKMPYMTHQAMTLIPVEWRGLGTTGTAASVPASIDSVVLNLDN